MLLPCSSIWSWCIQHCKPGSLRFLLMLFEMLNVVLVPIFLSCCTLCAVVLLLLAVLCFVLDSVVCVVRAFRIFIACCLLVPPLAPCLAPTTAARTFRRPPQRSAEAPCIMLVLQ